MFSQVRIRPKVGLKLRIGNAVVYGIIGQN